ncbi:TRAP transporter substrate-binding protein [Enterocloster bolteae]|uniref:TRAP transporter substrate-binding protein n=1 Tax=Enterocloster bolteae TaxID=208479 RepID=UPI00189E69CC|nr:TRAP transporter substrate-binding protein [Enterocloster bolteae]
MKKRMLAALLAGSMLLTACGGAGGQTASQAPKGEASQSAPADTGTQSGQKVTMKVSVGVADNHFEAVAVNKMKEYIEEQTGGNFTVEIFTGAQIGNDQEVFEGLKLGVADMLPCGTDIIGNFSKDFGLLSLPYLFDNEKQVEAVVEGEFGQSLLKKLEDIGYVGLGFGNFGFRHTTNSKHPINSVEDMKGLKIRTMTTPIHLEVFEALGANPTPMAFSELFSALQQGVVDGQENPLMNIYANKLHEVQKYLTLDGHVFTFVTFVVSKDWYDKLDPSYQQILNDGIKIATEYMKESCESEDALALEKMKEAGVEVVELTPEAKDEFREAVKGVSEKYGNEINPDKYKEMLDIIASVQ